VGLGSHFARIALFSLDLVEHLNWSTLSLPPLGEKAPFLDQINKKQPRYLSMTKRLSQRGPATDV
jgi:hypothetical protein